MVEKYNVKDAKITKKGHAKPLINPSALKYLTYFFGLVSAFLTSFYLSFLFEMTGMGKNLSMIAAAILGLGFTVAYMVLEFDRQIAKLTTGKRSLWATLSDNKFLYCVRVTTIVGTGLLIYSGIEQNDQIVESDQKIMTMIEEEIDRRRAQEKNLLDRGIVSATDSTVSKTLRYSIDQYIERQTEKAVDKAALIKYISKAFEIDYKLCILFMGFLVGFLTDLTISILTAKCAKISHMSLESFYLKRVGVRAAGASIERQAVNPRKRINLGNESAKEILRMKDQGFKQAEIARKTGKSRSWVSTVINQSKKAA